MSCISFRTRLTSSLPGRWWRSGISIEHVSGANTFFGPSGLIFPADVQSSNCAAKQGFLSLTLEKQA
jgi:hypothetical protein